MHLFLWQNIVLVNESLRDFPPHLSKIVAKKTVKEIPAAVARYKEAVKHLEEINCGISKEYGGFFRPKRSSLDRSLQALYAEKYTLEESAEATRLMQEIKDNVDGYWRTLVDELKSTTARPTTRLSLEQVIVRYMRDDPRRMQQPLIVDACPAERYKLHCSLEGVCNHESRSFDRWIRYLVCSLPEATWSWEEDQYQLKNLRACPTFIRAGVLPFQIRLADYFPTDANLSPKEAVLATMRRLPTQIYQ